MGRCAFAPALGEVPRENNMFNSQCWKAFRVECNMRQVWRKCFQPQNLNGEVFISSYFLSACCFPDHVRFVFARRGNLWVLVSGWFVQPMSFRTRASTCPFRCLPLMDGWPASSARMLASPVSAAAEVNRLKNEWEQFQRLKAAVEDTLACKKFADRHLFGRATNAQLIDAFLESNFVLTQPIVTHLTKRFAKVSSTQIVEDSFNCTKNDKVLVRRKQLGRPEKATAVLMTRGILSDIHRFPEIAPASSNPLRGAAPPTNLFRMSPTECKFPVKELTSTRQDTKWFSPNAENSAAPVADLKLIADAVNRNNLRLLQHAWLGTLARWQHKVILRTPNEEHTWAFALGPVGDSAVLVWPAKQHVYGVDGSTLFFEPVLTLKRPVMLSIFDLGDWEACCCQWRSPAWVVRHCPGAPMATSVIAMRSSATMTLKQLASKYAFWDLPMSTLRALAEHVGAPASSSTPAFDLVFGHRGVSHRVETSRMPDQQVSLPRSSFGLGFSMEFRQFSCGLLCDQSRVGLA